MSEKAECLKMFKLDFLQKKCKIKPEQRVKSMLVQFKVKNYRTFAYEQVFTLVSSAASSKTDNKSFDSNNSIAPRLLKSACILGPNGSGKSSLIMALSFFQEFVVTSSKNLNESDNIEVHPNKFFKNLSSSPTEMEISFIYKDFFYQYGFELNNKKVISEWMYARANSSGSRMRHIFSREFSNDKNDYEWNISESIKGEREVWRKSTRENALFFSTAVQLNSDFFKEPYHWIRTCLKILKNNERYDEDHTGSLCLKDETKIQVMSFLKSLGMSFDDIIAEEKELEVPERFINMLSEEKKKEFLAAKMKRIDINTIYKDSENSDVSLKFSEESSGTQFLISLAGPWIDVLEKGYTIVFDELHNNLHPHALKHIVSMFNSRRYNPNNAQLIFTTHDPNVVSGKLMEKDQIWLISREKFCSHLYPLSDFEIRNTASFARNYLAGKFGALPFTKDVI